MFAFVVFGLVFLVLCHDIGLEDRLRDDLLCVRWDVKCQLSQLLDPR